MGITLQYRSRSILSYYKRDKAKKSAKNIFKSIERQRSIDALTTHERYTGLVTHGSQKRLTRAIENMLQIAKPKFFTHNGKTYPFKINFITLTLYSFNRKVPGNEGHKKCLEPLLRWLRSKGMTCYVWKAELQSKRKDCHQLHYHLTTDVFVDLEELRHKWNELQRKAGYLDYHYEKFGNWNPNSTDIHATYKQKNMIAYLKKSMVTYSDRKKYQHLRTKYLVAAEMAKVDHNKETVEGKVWDCSYNIKTAYFEIEAFYDITSVLAKAVQSGEMVKKEFERCIVYELVKRNRNAHTYLPYPHREFYHHHINNMINNQRLKPDINAFSSS